MSLTVEDRLAIQELHARYAYAFDGADAEAWVAVFAADGRFAPPGLEPVIGHAALREFVTARSQEAPGMRHLIVNITVEAEGDHARGKAYFLALRIGGDGQFRMRNFGRYDDVFVRVDGGWRIASRDVVAELPVDLVDAPFAFGTVVAS